MSIDTVSPADWDVTTLGYQPPALTIHLHQRTFVLAWHTFLFAEGTDVEVRCVFHAHTVLVKGSGLSALLTDLAAHRVSILTEPARTERFRERTGPLVAGITVTENK